MYVILWARKPVSPQADQAPKYVSAQSTQVYQPCDQVNSKKMWDYFHVKTKPIIDNKTDFQ